MDSLEPASAPITLALSATEGLCWAMTTEERMDYSLWRAKPLPFKSVTITSEFWKSRINVVQKGALPAMYEQMKETGRWDCLKLQWKPGDPNKPHQFWDSDIAKWLEAACYTLAAEPDEAISKLVEEAVDNVRGAQQEDGYINTYYTVVEPEMKWKNIAWSHELYCAGHLLEAALAHETYSGSYRLLDPLLKYIKYIDSVFGLEDDKKKGYPGHEEIEIALVRAHERTEDDTLKNLARYFIEERGQPRPEGHYYDIEARAQGNPPRPGPGHGPPYSYHQADRPIRELTSIEGHSVRAMYWLAGAAGVTKLTGDKSLKKAIERLWMSTTHRKMYVTGGLGAIPEWEGLGPDYYLPNETGYLETCAAVALVFFSHQMQQLDPLNAEYGNVLELALYNAALVGMALDGKSFFYDNPLATNDSYLSRSRWFTVACCPANIARLVGSVGQYAYTVGIDNTIYVQLYISSTATIALNNGTEIKLTQETSGPWQGGSTLTLESTGSLGQYTVCLRKPPGVSGFRVTLSSEGAIDMPVPINPRSEFVEIQVTKKNVKFSVDFTFTIRRIYAHPLDLENRSCVAFARGPFIYCAESIDNPSIPDLRLIRFTEATMFEEIELGDNELADMGFSRDGQLSKAVIIKMRVRISGRFEGSELTLIPYFMWANRGKSDLRVWLPRDVALPGWN